MDLIESLEAALDRARKLQHDLDDKDRIIERLENIEEQRDDTIRELEEKLKDEEDYVELKEVRDALGLPWDARRERVIEALQRIGSHA